MTSASGDLETGYGKAGSLWELLHVAFPLMISAGSLALMNVVDRAFLAQYSLDAFAASMPAAMLNWCAMSLPLGIASYCGAFFSQYEGAGRPDRVASTLWQGVFMSAAGGILLQPIIFAAPAIFASMGHDAAVQEQEVLYFSALCPVAISTLISLVLSEFFAARKKAAIVMWVNVTVACLNALLDWLLIFGHAGLPALGIQGAAIATVTSSFVGGLLFAVFVWRESRRGVYPFGATFGLDFELIRRMIRFGFPNSIQMLLDIGAFTLFISLIGRLGKDAQAATNLAFTLNSMAFVPMLGMGTAVLTLVGRRVGEGRPDLASQTVWKSFLVSGTYMIVYAVLYLTIPETILAPFLNGTEREAFDQLQPMVITLLRFVALYTFFDAMAIVFGSAVRGAGDTMFSLIFVVCCGWLLLVAPTMWIIHHGGDLYQCWTVCTCFVIFLGTGFLCRFLQGKWKSMRVIEANPEAP